VPIRVFSRKNVVDSKPNKSKRAEGFEVSEAIQGKDVKIPRNALRVNVSSEGMKSGRRNTPATNGHLRTRRDHASETAEDYVEAIAMFQESKAECRLKDLAAHFMVSHVTVSKILARLAREGLVEITPYAPVKLKSSGVELASRARVRHELVLEFLVALGVTQSAAQADAEGIEHHVSDETLLCMKRFIAAKRQN